MDTTILLGGVAVAAVAFLLGRATSRSGPSPDPEAFPGLQESIPSSGIYAYAQRINFEVAHASELLADAAFAAGVQQLHRSSVSIDDLFAYASGSNEAVAYMALEELSRRKVDAERVAVLLDSIATGTIFEQYFLLKVLAKHTPADRPLVGEVLFRCSQKRHESWLDMVPLVDDMRRFINQRIEAGEQPTFGERIQAINDDQHKELTQTIDRLHIESLSPLMDELRERSRSRIDVEFLNSVGRVWESEDIIPEPVIEHDALLGTVNQLHTVIAGGRRGSVLLVGESGVGKSAIVEVCGRRLMQDGWRIFEASASDLIAGQSFIGQIEARVQTLLQQLGGARRVLWVIPDFHLLAWTGQSLQSQVSALDLVLPAIERGDITVLGRSEPGEHERLVQVRPRCSMALQTIRVAPLERSTTLALAKDWVRQQGNQPTPLATDEILEEAMQLAQQFLGDRATPGNLLELLSRTLHRLRAGTSADKASDLHIQIDDLIVTLTQMTGLPAAILDERQALDLASLRRHFESRVLGQPDAIDCLVERVAMTKAGVTDPTRPAGVFLLVGPTGTGKTELAKALAEFLFGSPDRMIRLDMSEFQSLEAMPRLVGTPGAASGRASEGSLVESVRRQPFSVILLDEFEKAHPNIWDLFLQVFDDGRLTDGSGRVADFRQSTILMTSNLGAMVPSGTSLGFATGASQFEESTVLRSVEKAFRREFVNRIDRVIVLRPLNTDTMAKILVKELEAVFERRGLRNRGWAVEWDESAISFLLERGFTRDLGARPLKRAIERHLLAPLATTIVDHQYPEGDQFLFVTAAGGELGVQFVDPDAPAKEEDTKPRETPGEAQANLEVGPLLLESIVLQPMGTQAELDCLQARLQVLQERVSGETWGQVKRQAVDRMSQAGFWDSPERFAVLGTIEYVDRVEAGVQRAASLLRRIAGRRVREQYPVQMVQSLAQGLYLLTAASADVLEGRPNEAFVSVEAATGAGISERDSGAFAERVGDMYLKWANRRNMRCDILDNQSSAPSCYRLLLAISGYGAYSLLRHEEGMHVFEKPTTSGARHFQRSHVHVRVRPQPDRPAAEGDGSQALASQAKEAMAGGPTERQVVRRYREEPSPLTRDSVGGWRSGRTADVLDGNFDLIAALQRGAEGGPSR